MDLALPGIDGWEVTRQLKNDARCDSFLAKPCLPEDLVREIRRILPTE